MCRLKDLKCKEVINVRDGCRYGYVNDIIVDVCTGLVHYLIVPEDVKLFGILGCSKEYVIPWKNVVKVSDDVILVDIRTAECLCECK